MPEVDVEVMHYAEDVDSDSDSGGCDREQAI